MIDYFIFRFKIEPSVYNPMKAFQLNEIFNDIKNFLNQL